MSLIAKSIILSFMTVDAVKPLAKKSRGNKKLKKQQKTNAEKAKGSETTQDTPVAGVGTAPSVRLKRFRLSSSFRHTFLWMKKKVGTSTAVAEATTEGFDLYSKLQERFNSAEGLLQQLAEASGDDRAEQIKTLLKELGVEPDDYLKQGIIISFQ